MELQVKELTRVFKFKKNNQDIELPDPDPHMTPDMVMNFYANQFPELTTATASGPTINNDMMLFTFSTTIGTKG